MATITPGTGATLTASTVEGQLWQWIMFMQRAEGNLSINTLAENRITGSLDIDSGLFTGNWSLPCTSTPELDGSRKIVANDYLTGLSFTPGNPVGSFVSPSWGNYGLELILHIIDLINLTSPTNRTPNVTASYNANTRVYSGAFRLPFTIDVNQQLIPTEYV